MHEMSSERLFTGVVSYHGSRDIRVWANDSHSTMACGGQWQSGPTVVKQDDTLMCCFKGQVLMGLSAYIFWAQISEWLGRWLTVKHAQPHLDCDCVGKSIVYVNLT